MHELLRRAAHALRLLAEGGLVVIAPLPVASQAEEHRLREAIAPHPLLVVPAEAASTPAEFAARVRAMLHTHPQHLPA